MTLLDELRDASEIVPETAELRVVEAHKPHHVDLSTARITAAAQQPEHDAIVDAAILWAQRLVGKKGNRKLVAMRAVERLELEFAREILARIDGVISIDVDGRLAFKRRQMIDRSRMLLEQADEMGLDRSRILLKIPATWEGIEAARKLREKNGVRCHMTLVFGMHQVAACADAGAAVIAPAVGRITDYHKKKHGIEHYPAHEDPGVLAARRMDRYLADHGYDSLLMPGMFRGWEQAAALAGIKRLSLPTPLLDLLAAEDRPLSELTTPAASEPVERLTVDLTTFKQMHSADDLANKKLASAVQNQSWGYVSQEKQLCEWIATRQDAAAETSTLALFRTWDYDGDGFIDREEWNGSDEVFNALDRDNNGRISLEEMAIGLGSPYRPDDE
jgi:transaldolase